MSTYTIEAALESELSDVVVATNGDEIATTDVPQRAEEALSQTDLVKNATHIRNSLVLSQLGFRVNTKYSYGHSAKLFNYVFNG